MKDFDTLSRKRTHRQMNEQVSSWLTSIDGLKDVHERMIKVVITNTDATILIPQQDDEDTLFYCDPPYLQETRVTKFDYEFEMTRIQHAKLLITLSRITGKFILSGYPSALYHLAMKKYGWFCTEIKIDNKASSASIKEIKTECLWTNFNPETGIKNKSNA